MDQNTEEALGDAPSRMSRRSLLKSAAALASVAPRPAHARQTNLIPAYVGTYTGSGGNGKGIYRCEMNPSTGELSRGKLVSDVPSPTWLAFDASRQHLYAINEISSLKGKASGSVSAFSIRRPTGDLYLLNTVSSGGAGPAYLSIHPSGKYALVANYAGGSVAVLSILPSGELGPSTDVKQDKGTVGSEHPTSAPPGNFAISGHDAPHAHMIHPDPSGRFVLSTDLGLDKIFVWRFDAQKGTLNSPQSASLPSGDGPRHFAFHPNGKWLYSIQEEASTLVLFDYDGVKGTLSRRQTLSALPPGFAGTSFGSEVAVSPDGRFVYAANRLHDSIAHFTIGRAGGLTRAGETWTRGDYPRNFAIDPTGNFLYSCNRRGDSITSFRVHRGTGDLTFTGQYTPVGSAAMILFLS
ncbi:MAG: lactonase family protein [Terriglobia bacterium]